MRRNISVVLCVVLWWVGFFVDWCGCILVLVWFWSWRWYIGLLAVFDWCVLLVVICVYWLIGCGGLGFLLGVGIGVYFGRLEWCLCGGFFRYCFWYLVVVSVLNWWVFCCWVGWKCCYVVGFFVYGWGFCGGLRSWV